MKSISVCRGELWKYATERGIPDGIAILLADSLREFKKLYCGRHLDNRQNTIVAAILSGIRYKLDDVTKV